MYASSCPFGDFARILYYFWDSALKILQTTFSGIPSFETNFCGIDCWKSAHVCPNKNKKYVGKTDKSADNFPFWWAVHICNQSSMDDSAEILSNSTEISARKPVAQDLICHVPEPKIPSQKLSETAWAQRWRLNATDDAMLNDADETYSDGSGGDESERPDSVITKALSSSDRFRRNPGCARRRCVPQKIRQGNYDQKVLDCQVIIFYDFFKKHAWFNIRDTPTNINQHQPTPTNINQHQPTSTNINQHQPTPTNINQHQPTSTNINQHQPTSTNINQNQPTNITQQTSTNQHQPTNINQPTSTNQHQSTNHPQSSPGLWWGAEDDVNYPHHHDHHHPHHHHHDHHHHHHRHHDHHPHPEHDLFADTASQVWQFIWICRTFYSKWRHMKTIQICPGAVRHWSSCP